MVKNKPSQEDLLLVQSIQITDKFGFAKKQQQEQQTNRVKDYDNYDNVLFVNDAVPGLCFDGIGTYKGIPDQRYLLIYMCFVTGFIVAATVFFVAQFIVIAIWSFLYRRRQVHQPYVNHFPNAATKYRGNNCNNITFDK